MVDLATLTAVPCLSFKVATLSLKYNVNIQLYLLIITILAINFNIYLTVFNINRFYLYICAN